MALRIRYHYADMGENAVNTTDDVRDVVFTSTAKRQILPIEAVYTKPGVDSNLKLRHQIANLPPKRSQGPNRASNACETCRTKKVKCNEEHPQCGFCVKHGFQCVYREGKDEVATRQILLVIEDKIDRIERVLDSLSLTCQTLKQPTVTPSSRVDGPNTSVSPESSQQGLHSTAPSFSTGDDTRSASELVSADKNTQCRSERYLLHEEERPPLRPLLDNYQLPARSEILNLIQRFFEQFPPLYPLICDDVVYGMASLVVARGFRDDIASVLVLLLIALIRAYDPDNTSHAGLDDFQYAVQQLGRLGTQFTLEMCQAYVLCGLFMLKQGRILEFWSRVNRGTTMLQTMLDRYKTGRVGRAYRPDEQNTILRFFWICLSMERDIVSEAVNLPSTQLHRFENSMPLPGSCDESTLTHLQDLAKFSYGFFLAEMSLRNILQRILSIPERELWPVQFSPGSTSSFLSSPSSPQCTGLRNILSPLSPVADEFEKQLETWLSNVPSFLKWTPDPVPAPLASTRRLRRRDTNGIYGVGARLKLLYWYARFLVRKGSIIKFTSDSYASPSQSLSPGMPWKESLYAIVKLVEVYLSDEPNIDILVAHRMLNAVLVAKRALHVMKLCGESEFYIGQVHDLLAQAVERLQVNVAPNSEWIAMNLSEWYS